MGVGVAGRTPGVARRGGCRSRPRDRGVARALRPDLRGRPADSARCLPMLVLHVEHYGAAPTHAAFDGGYASREYLKAAKALGVTHAVFHKKRGMKAADMTPSAWLYRQLKRFRAGVEAGISYPKRCFGLGLCRWRGLPRFKAYVQSAVFAHNLMRLARLRPQLG